MSTPRAVRRGCGCATRTLCDSNCCSTKAASSSEVGTRLYVPRVLSEVAIGANWSNNTKACRRGPGPALIGRPLTVALVAGLPPTHARPQSFLTMALKTYSDRTLNGTGMWACCADGG